MRFRKASLQFIFANHWDTEKFINFRDEFRVEGYHWIGGGLHEPATYFVNLLQHGASAKRCTSRDSAIAYYQHLGDFSKYNTHIFDHAMWWKLKDRQVICTSMPYSTQELTMKEFAEMREEFSFPASIKLRFLDDKYKYRVNGHFMLMIYDDKEDAE